MSCISSSKVNLIELSWSEFVKGNEGMPGLIDGGIEEFVIKQ
jgi:hypothetical protein